MGTTWTTKSHAPPPTYTLHLTTPGIQHRSEETPDILKIWTLNHQDNQHPRTQWIYVFIDGSSEEVVRKGGAGIQTPMSGPNKIEKSDLLPRENFQHIIWQSYRLFYEQHRCLRTTIIKDSTVFFRDCASILQIVQNAPEDLLTKTTMEQLHKLSINNVLLQWIPAQFGTLRIQTADRQVEAKIQVHQFWQSLPRKRGLIKRK